MVVSSRLRDATGAVAGVEQREAAGAIGRLHHAGRETALPDGRRLLVAGDAEDGDRRRRTDRRSCRNRRRSPSPPAAAPAARETARAAPRPTRRCGYRTAACARHWWHRSRARVPPVSRQIRKLSTVPKASCPASAAARAPSTWSSIQAILVAEKYGSSSRPVLRRRPSARGPSRRSAAQMSAVRRSCQTIALWIGLPVARSQIDRGLALIGDADAGDVLRARARPSPSRRARSRRRSTRSPPDRARPSRAPDRSAGTPAARPRPD